MGIGWNISGVSQIERGGKNFYHDGPKVEKNHITFTDEDQLYLDGQRLILLSGKHLQLGAVYGFEVENYARVTIKQIDFQQSGYINSCFWRKEYGGFLLEDGNVSRFPASWRHSHGITPPDGSEIKVPSDAFAMYHTHWDTSGKTIWVNPLGQRVDNSSNPLDLIQPGVYKTSTSRGHSPTDFLSIDSYVINRYETVFNAGRTSVLNVIRDPFLRYFPWYLIYMK